jgi:hypothetical protein
MTDDILTKIRTQHQNAEQIESEKNQELLDEDPSYITTQFKKQIRAENRKIAKDKESELKDERLADEALRPTISILSKSKEYVIDEIIEAYAYYILNYYLHLKIEKVIWAVSHQEILDAIVKGNEIDHWKSKNIEQNSLINF